jgi:hypothetical protein
MKNRWRRTLSVGAIVVVVSLALWVLAPIGRPTLEDAARFPSPVPVADIPVPPGGVALFYGPQEGSNLIVIAPDGTITFQPGVVYIAAATDNAWTWQPQRGAVPSTVHISPAEAKTFISTAEEIAPPSDRRVLPHIGGVSAGYLDRRAFWGVIHNGSVDQDYYYRGEADPFLVPLGMPPPATEMVMPTQPPTRIPSDAIGFVYENMFFIVHRSGAVSMQIGSSVLSGSNVTASGWRPTWDSSLTYDVKPISPYLAWKIVTLGAFVYVPPGCPGLDDAATYRYLVVVDSHGVSNSLFCHRWSPLRDDFMSIVQVVVRYQ